MGLSNSNTALASLNNQEFLVNLNSYNNDGFGENIGNGTTNLYIIRTPLARWNEECTVLDSHSMHHAILLNKPRICESLEKYRNEELNEKRLKRLKEETEKLKRQQQLQAQAIATNVANAAANAAVAATSASATTNLAETVGSGTVESQAAVPPVTGLPEQEQAQEMMVTGTSAVEVEQTTIQTGTQAQVPSEVEPTLNTNQTGMIYLILSIIYFAIFITDILVLKVLPPLNF